MMLFVLSESTFQICTRQLLCVLLLPWIKVRGPIIAEHCYLLPGYPECPRRCGLRNITSVKGQGQRGLRSLENNEEELDNAFVSADAVDVFVSPLQWSV